MVVLFKQLGLAISKVLTLILVLYQHLQFVLNHSAGIDWAGRIKNIWQQEIKLGSTLHQSYLLKGWVAKYYFIN